MESVQQAWFRSQPAPALRNGKEIGAVDLSEGTGEIRAHMDVQEEPPKRHWHGGAAGFDRLFWITAAVVVGVPVAALVAYHTVRFAGLANPDAMDFAQAGRCLISGRGFSTNILRPLALEHGANAIRQPDLVHGPLYPFVLALVFGLAGVSDTVVSLVSGFFYLLAMPLLYLLGRRMFQPPIALATTLVFALNPLVLDYAVSGLHIPLLVCLATALFLVTTRYLQVADSPSANGAANRGLAAAGALTGLLYLVDPIFIWIVPAIAAAVLARPRVPQDSAAGQPSKARIALAFGVPLAIVVLPWMIRNGLLTGNPVFALKGAEVWMGTRVYPGSLGYRMMPGSLAPTAGLFGAIVRKMLVGINEVLTGLPQLSSTLVLAFFLPGIVFRLKDPTMDRMRRTGVLCFVSLCLGMLLFGVQMSVLLAFLPIVLLFSVAYITHLFQQARVAGTGLAVAYSLIACATVYPVIDDLALTDRAKPLPIAASARALGRQSNAGDACVTDQPWAVAWYADRPSLWIPVSDEQMLRASKQIGGVRSLLITGQARSFSPSWQEVYDSFAEWNAACRQARVENSPLPAPLIVDGSGQPVMEALDGFASVAPVDGQALDVVMAREEPGERDAPAPEGDALHEGETP